MRAKVKSTNKYKQIFTTLALFNRLSVVNLRLFTIRIFCSCFVVFQESLVACAAFKALSMFDPSDFKLIHLPEKVQ